MSLIPRLEPQKLKADVWLNHTPGENKLELMDGQACYGGAERDRLLLALIYNVGFEHFLAILTQESREILRELCTQEKTVDQKMKITLDILGQYFETTFGEEESKSLRDTVGKITDIDTIERIIERILDDNILDENIENIKSLIQSENV